MDISALQALLSASWQQVTLATVGWEGVPDHVELSQDANDDSGVALIRVTTLEMSKRQLLCQPMSNPIWATYPKGSTVVVLFPFLGMYNTDGSPAGSGTDGHGIIIGMVGAAPDERFGRRKAVADIQQDFVVKARNIAFLVEDDDGGRHMLSIGSGGVTMKSGGSEITVSGPNIQIKAVDGTKTLARIDINTSTFQIAHTSDPSAPSWLIMKAGKVTLAGGKEAVVGGITSTTIGSPAAANTALPPLVGAPPGSPSLSVKVTP